MSEHKLYPSMNGVTAGARQAAEKSGHVARDNNWRKGLCGASLQPRRGYPNWYAESYFRGGMCKRCKRIVERTP